MYRNDDITVEELKGLVDNLIYYEARVKMFITRRLFQSETSIYIYGCMHISMIINF